MQTRNLKAEENIVFLRLHIKAETVAKSQFLISKVSWPRNLSPGS